MPKKFTVVQLREWLEKYEHGKSEASIAREVHCDVRTVKRGLEQARRERDAHGARAELLTRALQTHHQSLLSVLREMLASLVEPAHNLDVRIEQEAIPSRIPLPGGKADYITGQGWVVSLHVEDKPEWSLLQEHLKRDPIWNSFAQWKKAVAAEIEARVSLKRKAVALLKEKIEYKLVDRLASSPEVYIRPLITLMYQPTLNRILGIPDGTNFKERIVADIAHGEVRFADSTIARVPGAEEKCRGQIINATKELERSTEAKDVAKARKAVEEYTKKASGGVEEVSLLGLVPGQCRVCKRLGM